MVSVLIGIAGICFFIAGAVEVSKAPWLGAAYTCIGMANICFSMVSK